jgi:hypothetical protein
MALMFATEVYANIFQQSFACYMLLYLSCFSSSPIVYISMSQRKGCDQAVFENIKFPPYKDFESLP